MKKKTKRNIKDKGKVKYSVDSNMTVGEAFKKADKLENIKL